MAKTLTVEHRQKLRDAWALRRGVPTTRKGRPGRLHTEESKRKISLANSRRRLSAATRKKISEGNFGKVLPLAVRLSMARSHRGKPLGPDHCASIGKGLKSFWASERSQTLREALTSLGFWGRFRTIRLTPEFDQVQVVARRARLARPNKLEAAVAVILEQCFPGEWVYNPGAVRVGNRIPDFVHVAGDAVLEVFGDYWHWGEDVGVVIQHYGSLGYRCSVVWEAAFRHDPTAAVHKALQS